MQHHVLRCDDTAGGQLSHSAINSSGQMSCPLASKLVHARIALNCFPCTWYQEKGLHRIETLQVSNTPSIKCINY